MFCNHCDGTGKARFNNPCLICEGTGHLCDVCGEKAGEIGTMLQPVDCLCDACAESH
jgi:RecJ-like exonuclease